jgi:hypothetical protein
MAREDADRDEDDDDRPRRRDRDRDEYDSDYRPSRRRRRRDDEDDRGDPTGGLIPLNNGMALAAYYCGVFSFIPCVSAILGPLAVIFGFIGLAKANKHPEAKGKGHSIAGIVCGSLTSLLTVAGIVYVAVMAAAK